MKIYSGNLTDSRNEAAKGQNVARGVKDYVGSELEILEDGLQYDTLNFYKISNAATNAERKFKEFRDMVDVLLDRVQSVESEISSMHIGDNVSLGDGVTYWENGRGGGRHGTVGQQYAAGDDFYIDRVAFYVNGNLVLNTNETGADIGEMRAQYAKEYGVDVSEVEVSYHVGKGEGSVAGWIQDGQGISYSDKVTEVKKQSNEDIDATIAKIKQDYEIDKKAKEYEERYGGVKNVDSVTTTVTPLQTREYASSTSENVSFLASVGEGAVNVLVGALKVPVFAVTGIVDSTTNTLTFGHGTHLTKYENDAFEELADATYREGARNAGSVGMSNTVETLQEFSGAVLLLAVAAEAASSAGPQMAKEYVQIGDYTYEAGSQAAADAAARVAAEEAATQAAEQAAEQAAIQAAEETTARVAEQEVLWAIEDAEAQGAQLIANQAAETAAETAATNGPAVIETVLESAEEASMALEEAAGTGAEMVTEDGIIRRIITIGGEQMLEEVGPASVVIKPLP